jgi:hypothetical protein
MGDKTDRDDFLSSLERVLVEYQGMKYILNQFPLSSSDSWRRLLRDFLDTRLALPIYQEIDVVRGIPQSDTPDARLFASLKEVLNKVTTL